MSQKKHSDERSQNSAAGGKPFSEIIADRIARRSFVQWFAAGVSGAMGSSLLVEPKSASAASSLEKQKGTDLFGFSPVPASNRDQVVVPEGYVAQVLYRWGDPINGEGPQFNSDASNSAEDQELQAGMGHDGMEYFAIPGQDPNQRGLLAINHEYTDQVLLFKDGLGELPPAMMPLEKVRKSMASHGVSIVEVQKMQDGNWRVVPSPRARRITADTPVQLSGPATAKVGMQGRGTVNNCAAGRTPWGTYLTCEENFQQIFGSADKDFAPNARQKLYGLNSLGFYYMVDGQKVAGFRWWEQYPRFELSHPENDSERFGYVVEIDPQDPTAPPVKRTALGRIRHENAELTISDDGRVVVYMGDDEMNQFIYKFVSKGIWNPDQQGKDQAQGIHGSGIQARGGLLDQGTLYVARFDESGRGRWLELAPGKNGIPTKQQDAENGFDEADICIYTRQAAQLAGATAMDRPEWLAVDPNTKQVYASLTNNKSRTEPNAANPRTANVYGHILRWSEAGNDAAALEFNWDVFVLGGNPTHSKADYQCSAKGDFFACPDGLKFDRSGILWIQTDMSSSVMGKTGFVELGNNMMLAADTTTGEVRRFLTGPVGCEITGMSMTPDRKTMFVNIQHPGEPSDELSDVDNPNEYSNWPDGPSGGRPRSATIAIRRIDGRVIGA